MPKGVYPRKKKRIRLPKNYVELAEPVINFENGSQMKFVGAQKPEKLDSTAELLASRRNQHGNWEDNARASRLFKDIIHGECILRKERGQSPLTDSQREALEMIVHKIGRILSGDAAFNDHWDDIAGYARLGKEGHRNG